MGFTQKTTLANTDYNDPVFVNTLHALHNFHPQFKLNTFDVVNYTKPTDQKTEADRFTIRLMTTRCNSPTDLDELNNELKTRRAKQRLMMFFV